MTRREGPACRPVAGGLARTVGPLHPDDLRAITEFKIYLRLRRRTNLDPEAIAALAAYESGHEPGMLLPYAATVLEDPA
jgi:hypothetical protein